VGERSRPALSRRSERGASRSAANLTTVSGALLGLVASGVLALALMVSWSIWPEATGTGAAGSMLSTALLATVLTTLLGSLVNLVAAAGGCWEDRAPAHHVTSRPGLAGDDEPVCEREGGRGEEVEQEVRH
jgi:hypothetical protein